MLLDLSDFGRPGAALFVGVGYASSVLAFGFSEMIEQDVESVFEGRASHNQKPIILEGDRSLLSAQVIRLGDPDVGMRE